jgi:aspartate 1-decarboxylase
METAEARVFEPRVVFVDADNRITHLGGDAAEAPDGSGLRRGDADERANSVQAYGDVDGAVSSAPTHARSEA